MSNTILHKADTRGDADHGWLHSRHTFSFANYRNPERVHFGALRVINDDFVAPGKGFGTHPHDNMEIVSIPLEGTLEHKDSMGNTGTIKKGDIQMMSAGTGIMHSEYNASKTEPVKFLQIWVFPDKQNVTPRYDQIKIDEEKASNRFLQILSPNPDDEGVWVHQQAWFHLGKFNEETSIDYEIKATGNGLYVFVLEGEADVEGVALSRRDGFGIWDKKSISFNIKPGAELLLMEVPMKW